jgi:membrane protease YdiL (CAAX protease family)
VFDLLILSLGFMIHLWALPYSFKNILFDSIVSLVQLGFGFVILFYGSPSSLLPSAPGLIGGAGIGVACFVFQLLFNRGVKITRSDLNRRFFLSQLVLLFFFVPAEEAFYRGVFFSRLASIWGVSAAVLLSTSLSTMFTVVSSRKPLYWAGSAVMGVLCCLGFYYSGSIWTPILIHIGNDIGFQTLNERRSLF